MEKVIRIVNCDGAECDVLVTERELASFRELTVSAAEAGQHISFDEWVLDELRRAFADVPPEGEYPPLLGDTFHHP
jgi:hypothetical protein